MSTNQHYSALLEKSMRDYYVDTLGLTERQYQVSAAGRYAMKRGERVAQLLDREVGLSGKVVLDVGSGWGEITYKTRTLGAQSYGIEPDPMSVQVASELNQDHWGGQSFTTGVGEALPFPDDTFDVVICNHVLEHVQSPPQVVSELVRVVCKGGVIFLAFPNYMMPFEGHYRLPWIPFLPKRLGSLYLRILGRDPVYYQHYINYVTYHNVMKHLRKHPITIRCLTDERLEKSLSASNPVLRLLRSIQLQLKLHRTVSFLLVKQEEATKSWST